MEVASTAHRLCPTGYDMDPLALGWKWCVIEVGILISLIYALWALVIFIELLFTVCASVSM